MNQGEKSQKQVPQQLTRLDDLITTLDKSLEVLRENLAPILTPPDQVRKELSIEEAEKQQSLSPLAHSLRGACERIEQMYLLVKRLGEELQI